MTKKSLILSGLLSISMLAFAGSKSYEITLVVPSTIGSMQLAAGDYKVKVDGGNAVFTNTHSAKSFTTPVKVETAGKKFQFTAVDATKDGKSERINAIELGGSATKLDFTTAAGPAQPTAPGSQQ